MRPITGVRNGLMPAQWHEDDEMSEYEMRVQAMELAIRTGQNPIGMAIEILSFLKGGDLPSQQSDTPNTPEESLAA